MLIFLTIVILWFMFFYLPNRNKSSSSSNNQDFGLSAYKLQMTPFQYLGYTSDFSSSSLSYKGIGMHTAEIDRIYKQDDAIATQIYFSNLGFHSFFKGDIEWLIEYNLDYNDYRQRFIIKNGMLNQTQFDSLDSNFNTISEYEQIDLYTTWVYIHDLLDSNIPKNVLGNIFSSTIVLNNLIKKNYLQVEMNSNIITYTFVNDNQVNLTRYLIDLYEEISKNYELTLNRYYKIKETEQMHNAKTKNDNVQILHKIDKLLLTAEEGTNQNESLVAYQKAQKLMKKYNITYTDVEEYRANVA
ncbi:DUF2786 domain-containing protein [Peribacillus sp. NPDC097198]|uniref:DUF2786 domain-containing protein n=1 Tax=Peribacillus sp. NPDC097198 TaxID=3364397 RepID=UPI003804990A